MTNFENRINWQRNVLKVVNKNFPDEPLHGLTFLALCEWQQRVSSQNVDKLFEQLVELSKLIDSLDDHSVPRNSPISEIESKVECLLKSLELEFNNLKV